MGRRLACTRFSVLLLAGCGGRVVVDGEPAPPSSCPVTSAALAVAATHDLGALPLPPSVRTASGGATGRIGGQVLWALAQADLAAPADNGDLARTSIAGWASPEAPLAPTYPLDPDGAPTELIPLTADERAYNAENAPQSQLVVWPLGVLPEPAGGRIFFGRFTVGQGPLEIDFLGVGVARVGEGEAQAQRVVEELFVPPGRPYGLSPQIDGDLVYVYGCGGGGSVPGCGVLRAPLSGVDQVSAWEAWDGAAWTPSIGAAATLFDGPPGDLSVAYHPHLGRYVAVYTEAFTDRVVMRSAPRPEGPWSAPVLAFTTIAEGDYAGKEHPELSKDCGRTMVVSYYHPEEGGGELRLVEVALE